MIEISELIDWSK